MTEKEIAKLILARVDEAQAKGNNLKVVIEELLKWLLSSVKEVTGTMPDEDTFLKVLAEIIDQLLPLPLWLEPFDSVVAYKVLKTLDQVLLDKLFGKDWYKDLISKVA